MSLPDNPPDFNNLDNFEPDKLPATLVDGLCMIAQQNGYSTLSQCLYEEAYKREEIEVQEMYDQHTEDNTSTIVSSMESK